MVTLQEVWLASDAALLAQLGARGSLRYHHYFQGGVMGGELLTLSKHPILEVRFFSQNTKINNVKTYQCTMS